MYMAVQLRTSPLCLVVNEIIAGEEIPCMIDQLLNVSFC